MKIKLNGLLIIAVVTLAGCDPSERSGFRTYQKAAVESERMFKAMGKAPAPDPRAKKMWGIDLRAAQARAKKHGKRILLDFTDSSSDYANFRWDFIFTQPEFLNFAEKNLELVQVDSAPRHKRGAMPEAEAQKLKKMFDVAGLPIYFILDGEGKIFWPTTDLFPSPSYVLDGTSRTNGVGSVPQAPLYFETAKEFTDKLRLKLKSKPPLRPGIKKGKTAEEPVKIVEKAFRRRLDKPTGKLSKADLDGVTSLSFGNTDVTDQDLKELVKVGQITSLGLRPCPQVTNEGLKELAKLKQLNTLYLGGPNITDATLKELANLQQLDSLHLTDCPKVTDEGLIELARLKKLHTVYLSYSQVTQAGKFELRQALPRCRISLNNSYRPNVANLKPPKTVPLTAEETAEIIETAIGQQLSKPTSELTETDWQKVTELKFTFTKISDGSLKEVAKLDQLKMLWLDNNQITDTGLKEVAKLQQLTHLGLAGTYITDAGIKELAKLKQLSWVNLRHTNITVAGVAALKKALPICKISFFN